MDRIHVCMDGMDSTDKKKISWEAFLQCLGRKAKLSVPSIPFVHAVALSIPDPYRFPSAPLSTRTDITPGKMLPGGGKGTSLAPSWRV